MFKKYFFKLTVLSLFTLTLILGCKGQDGIDGMDGEDGDSYVAFWFITPLIYATDDPNIPSIIFNTTYYKTYPGTYSFAYEAWDGSVWALNYTIVLDEGDPGEKGEDGELFWQDGEDGADGDDGNNLCVDIGLWSTGPDIYSPVECFGTLLGRTTGEQFNFIESYENELFKSGKKDIITDQINAMTDLTLAKYLYESDENEPQINIKIISSGKYTIKLVYKQIK